MTIEFTLDGKTVQAEAGESLWQVAKRHGTSIPHLCYSPEPGYRADGNCRACMVEIEGERVLAASCLREPTPGMVVHTESPRAEKARSMVFELLLADQPARDLAHDSQSNFWAWVDGMGVSHTSRYPTRVQPEADNTHAAISVNLDACIQCNLCVRACREVQSNDVIGLAYRGAGAKIVFDFDDGMGESTCVACGECVQACPTGALMESRLLDAQGVRTEFPEKSVDTVCPYCGVGCQTRVNVKGNNILSVDGRDGPANENRLCVKGRCGRWRSQAFACRARRRVACGIRFRQMFERGSLPLSKIHPPGLRHQQRRPLHTVVSRVIRGGAHGRAQFRRGLGAVHRRVAG